MYKIPNKSQGLLVKNKINEKKELPKLTKKALENSDVYKQTTIYDYMKIKKNKKKKNNIFEK
jgi:hypothetical protein